MASIFVEKYKRKPNTQTKDEFFVGEDKFNTVCQYKSKIHRMYNINVYFEKKPAEGGGRWMLMEGEPVDRRNAKNYIKAICHPEETKQVKFPASAFAEFAKGSILESIEKSTNAVIKPLKKVATFEISGTELGVTLALSQMEEIAGSFHLDPNEEHDIVGDIDENVFQISPVTNNASKRLATQLQRALSEHSDGICSIDDYKDAPPSVKRVLVNCLEDDEIDDIDEDLLFDDGSVNKKVSAMAEGSGRPSYIRVYSDCEDKTEDPIEIVSIDGIEGANDMDRTPSVGFLSERLDGTSLTSDSSLVKITKQQEYLRNFGLSVGYARDKVEQALNFVDEKTRPSDFLDLLNGITEKHSDHEDKAQLQDSSPSKGSESTITISDDDDDVIILETETFDMETGKGETISHEPENLNKQKKNINKNRDDECQASTANRTSQLLPDEYKTQLVLDMLQESDTSLSVEELKRKNAQRQRLLKENFSKQQKPAVQSSSQQTGANKKKTKNKKKKQSHQEQQPKPGGQIELHDKQFRLDSGENKTYSKDEEQTCVLRVWNDSIKESCAPYQGQWEMVSSPKRKQRSGDPAHSPIPDKNHYSGTNPSSNPSQSTHNNWSQPLTQKHDYRQNSPNRNKQDFMHSSPNRNKQGQWNQQQCHQSPQRPSGTYNQGKPTQVVTPNFSGTPQPLMSVVISPDREDLRYIVIDGSNVAMTHGNGKHFSCKGLRICVDYFKQRGHKKITVFVPQWRTKRASDDNPILDQNILYELKDEEVLVFTPSRRIGRKLVASYDDRFVMELAEAEDGIIVSNDQYRDLMQEKTSWRKMVEERLLMYSFVRDRFMVPNDPLGRDGPCLDDFLRKTETTSPFGHGAQGYQNHPGQFQGQGQQGHFHHKEHDFPRVTHQNGQFKQGPPQQKYTKQQGQKPGYGHSVMIFDDTDGAVKPVQTVGWKTHKLSNMDSAVKQPTQTVGWRTHNVPNRGGPQTSDHTGLSTRSDKDTARLLKELTTIFPDPGQEETIKKILTNHENETDLMKLTNYCMCVFFT